MRPIWPITRMPLETLSRTWGTSRTRSRRTIPCLSRPTMPNAWKLSLNRSKIRLPIFTTSKVLAWREALTRGICWVPEIRFVVFREESPLCFRTTNFLWTSRNSRALFLTLHMPWRRQGERLRNITVKEARLSPRTRNWAKRKRLRGNLTTARLPTMQRYEIFFCR